jgi:glutamate-5-semialdehyde dehydrogenase
LIHENIAEDFLPLLHERLCVERTEKGLPPVELRCDEKALAILGSQNYVVKAGDKDFDTEFLNYILAVKIVESGDEAIAHIGAHSTGHSDCIISEDKLLCEKFALCVDSAAVYVNASTRFTDGGEFGFGAEIGISTQKLHARGPMGLYALTTDKYLVDGDGQIR